MKGGIKKVYRAKGVVEEYVDFYKNKIKVIRNENPSDMLVDLKKIKTRVIVEMHSDGIKMTKEVLDAIDGRIEDIQSYRCE